MGCGGGRRRGQSGESQRERGTTASESNGSSQGSDQDQDQDKSKSTSNKRQPCSGRRPDPMELTRNTSERKSNTPARTRLKLAAHARPRPIWLAVLCRLQPDTTPGHDSATQSPAAVSRPGWPPSCVCSNVQEVVMTIFLAGGALRPLPTSKRVDQPLLRF